MAAKICDLQGEWALWFRIV